MKPTLVLFLFINSIAIYSMEEYLTPDNVNAQSQLPSPKEELIIIDSRVKAMLIGSSEHIKQNNQQSRPS